MRNILPIASTVKTDDSLALIAQEAIPSEQLATFWMEHPNSTFLSPVFAACYLAPCRARQ